MAEEKCPTCNKALSEVEDEVSFPVGKQIYIIRKLHHLKCGSCGERVFSLDAQELIEKTVYGKKTKVA